MIGLCSHIDTCRRCHAVQRLATNGIRTSAADLSVSAIVIGRIYLLAIDTGLHDGRLSARVTFNPHPNVFPVCGMSRRRGYFTGIDRPIDCRRPLKNSRRVQGSEPIVRDRGQHRKKDARENTAVMYGSVWIATMRALGPGRNSMFYAVTTIETSALHRKQLC